MGIIICDHCGKYVDLDKNSEDAVWSDNERSVLCLACYVFMTGDFPPEDKEDNQKHYTASP